MNTPATTLARPLLSIIIPHHNRPAMLDELMAGLPDRPDLEAWVVDDRSSNLPAPTRRFAHTQVHVIPTHTPTAGGARNTGLDHAQGRWIAFADSDDRIRPEALSRVMDGLDHGEADVVVCAPWCFRDDNGQEGDRHRRVAGIVRQLTAGAPTGLLAEFVPPWSKCIRAEFLNAHALRFSAVPVSNDVAFNARLVAAKPAITTSSEVFYEIRQGNDSLTSRRDLESLKTRIRELNTTNALLRQAGLGQHEAVAAGYILRTLRHSPKDAWALTRLLWQGGGRLIPRHPDRWRAWWNARQGI